MHQPTSCDYAKADQLRQENCWPCVLQIMGNAMCLMCLCAIVLEGRDSKYTIVQVFGPNGENADTYLHITNNTYRIIDEHY